MGFKSLHQKICEFINSDDAELQVKGLDHNKFAYILNNQLQNNLEYAGKNLLIICSSVEKAESVYEELSLSGKDSDIHFFPGLETSPYRGALHSEQDLFLRFRVLSLLLKSSKPQVIICHLEAALQKLPPVSFFSNHQIEIVPSDIISPLELSKTLTSLGYQPSTSVEEPGTFCQKGEIFDIFPISGSPARLHYFDDMIEEIFPIDINTGRTIKSKPIEAVSILPTPHIFSQASFANHLREEIPQPEPKFKEKFEKRKSIFAGLHSNQMFENFSSYISLFFSQNSSLSDYLKNNHLTYFLDSTETLDEANHLMGSLYREWEEEKESLTSHVIFPEPARVYYQNLKELYGTDKIILIDSLDISINLMKDFSNSVELSIEKSTAFLSNNVNPALERHQFIKESLGFLAKFFAHSGTIQFSVSGESSVDEIKNILTSFSFPEEIIRRTSFVKSKIRSGFFYSSEKLLVIGEGDLFSIRKSVSKPQQNKNLDLFAEQLASLKEGDYVIHNSYGVGKYLGLEKIDISASQTDYLVIEYTGKDKVYLPVYKMNLIQKHADSTSELSLDSLRSNKFSNLKKRAKSSIKKLAFDLLRLQAERESSKAFSFSPPDHEYLKFEHSFPFDETPDQALATESVLSGMQKDKPMDHLVCGDVGFGKTEIAMRAAYKAVLDNKQVAILVPTTVLCLQHYNSFKRRFKSFPVNIEYISRFRSAKEKKVIMEKVKESKVDILIGTHSLLSKQLDFADLGLVIVDEEQRFGVGHKEKLKLLKSSVDFLTLTATPIPRTLQLSFLGLKDLSLIKTPPPKRQSIKTYIIKNDDLTLKNAIEKEINRGGQVFIVHNRVNDIEDFTAHIKELCPSASIIFAHGQLSEKELEKRMNEFYSGNFQILISTTIIESGIDIPNANTMIIDRADTFGLSQLHQLRGRIGRSDRKAYAYFVIPNVQRLSTIAEKRLKVLQTYAEIGSGFNIANSDLEIRGAGDILGGEQSGHIEKIGLELYMELLKEEIQVIKGETSLKKSDLELNTPFPSFIPNNYITDPSNRLRFYKKLSNSASLDGIQGLMEELEDIYGILPPEVENLSIHLKCRVLLQGHGIKTIQVAGRSIILKFDMDILNDEPELRDKIVDYFVKQPKKYGFNPDGKVHYSHSDQVKLSDLFSFCQTIAEQIIPHS